MIKIEDDPLLGKFFDTPEKKGKMERDCALLSLHYYLSGNKEKLSNIPLWLEIYPGSKQHKPRRSFFMREHWQR
jgi:hypothetical protein